MGLQCLMPSNTNVVQDHSILHRIGRRNALDGRCTMLLHLHQSAVFLLYELNPLGGEGLGPWKMKPTLLYHTVVLISNQSNPMPSS